MVPLTMEGVLQALAGGVLIGLSASALLLANGRIAGISGIAGGLVGGGDGDAGWRTAFLLGLVGGGALLRTFAPGCFGPTPAGSTATVVLAGLLVGFGSRLGSGCTSGHGVCGLARRSGRSLVATLTFMSTGALAMLVASRLGWLR